MLQEVEKLKAAVDEELERHSTGALWGKPALQIMQLPGVGYITVGMTVLAAIGDTGLRTLENRSSSITPAAMQAFVVLWWDIRSWSRVQSS